MVPDITKRREVIDAALREHERSNSKSTLPINFRDRKTILPIVTLPVDIPLLNHNSHRLSAQLEDCSIRDQVFADPKSHKSQELLAELISSTEKYHTVRDDVKMRGQEVPGIVTIDGVLVNGNTRLVALREIGKAGIDVAVLPDGVTDRDLLNLELSLQVAKVVQQDYTYTNTLLMMKDCRELNLSDKELGKILGWQKKVEAKIESCLRILNLIEEIRDRALRKIPYSYFDRNQQSLEELDREYENLKWADPVGAQDLMDSRILAMLLGATKLNLREIKPDFIQDRVLNRLGEDARVLVDAYTSSDIGEMSAETSDSPLDLTRLIDRVIAEIVERGADVVVDWPLEFRDLGDTISLVSEEISLARRRGDAFAEPIRALKEARGVVEQIIERYEEYVISKEFNRGKFEIELKRLREKLDELNETNRKSA